MATTGVVNTKDLNMYLGTYPGTKFGRVTDASASFTHALRDTTSKDSGRYMEKDFGQLNATFSLTALLTYDDSYGGGTAGTAIGWGDMLDGFEAETPQTLTFTTGVVGDPYITMEVWITSLNKNSASTFQNGEFTVEFEINGPITKGTVA